MNHKKLQRLWREEGLRVPQRRRRKRLATSTTATTPTADAPNKVWAVDFQFDATTDGCPVKIVSIVDEHTRECLGGLVARSITADTLIDELDVIAAGRGYPRVLRCDNGPELACTAMADWAGERIGLAFIPPGEPWKNGYIESFNGRGPRRMSEPQPVLVPDPGPGHHQRLERRIQQPPTALKPGLPDPGQLRCCLHPPVTDSHRGRINHWGPVTGPGTMPSGRLTYSPPPQSARSSDTFRQTRWSAPFLREFRLLSGSRGLSLNARCPV